MTPKAPTSNTCLTCDKKFSLPIFGMRTKGTTSGCRLCFSKIRRLLVIPSRNSLSRSTSNGECSISIMTKSRSLEESALAFVSE